MAVSDFFFLVCLELKSEQFKSACCLSKTVNILNFLPTSQNTHMKVKYFDLFDDTVVEMLMLTFDILVCDLKRPLCGEHRPADQSRSSD